MKSMMKTKKVRLAAGAVAAIVACIAIVRIAHTDTPPAQRHSESAVEQMYITTMAEQMLDTCLYTAVIDRLMPSTVVNAGEPRLVILQKMANGKAAGAYFGFFLTQGETSKWKKGDHVVVSAVPTGHAGYPRITWSNEDPAYAQPAYDLDLAGLAAGK